MNTKISFWRKANWFLIWTLCSILLMQDSKVEKRWSNDASFNMLPCKIKHCFWKCLYNVFFLNITFFKHFVSETFSEIFSKLKLHKWHYLYQGTYFLSASIWKSWIELLPPSHLTYAKLVKIDLRMYWNFTFSTSKHYDWFPQFVGKMLFPGY